MSERDFFRRNDRRSQATARQGHRQASNRAAQQGAKRLRDLHNAVAVDRKIDSA